MKFKKLKITNGFKIKLIVISTLFFLLVLSFFFASNLEQTFGLKKSVPVGQVSQSELSGSEFFVDYIDVGQGSSTLISLPDGKTVLIDGGDVASGSVVVNAIEERGKTRVDYLVATHADSDHIGGLIKVLDELEVCNILRPFQIAGTGTSESSFVVYPDEDLAEAYTAMVSSGSRVTRVTSEIYKNFITKTYSETYTQGEREVSAGVTVFYDGLKISGRDYNLEFFFPEVLSPALNLAEVSSTGGYATKSYGVSDTNSGSAIMLLEVCGESFVFTGDAPYKKATSKTEPVSGTAELDFVQSLTADERARFSGVSVYLVGHHGSEYSSSTVLLSLILPKHSIISAAKNNDYGHPSVPTVNRLKNINTNIISTFDFGTITFAKTEAGLVYATAAGKTIERSGVSWYLFSTVIFVCALVLISMIKSPNAES